MKRIVLGFCICCLLGTVSAQNDISQQLKFSEKTFDIGRKREDKGKVSHIYMITNLGNVEAKLLKYEIDPKWKNVTITWDVTSIKQYERIHLNVTMDPKGMKWAFQIPFKLTTLIGRDTVTYDMKMKGYIDPAPTTKEEQYSMQEGHLKYITNSISYSRLGKNSVKQDTFKFYNAWDSVMTFRAGKVPACIKINYLTPSLKPNEEGFVVFTFNAEILNDWGNVFNSFTVLTNDPIPASHHGKKTFYISGEIYDDFSTWSPEQLKNAPRILIDEEEYNFGECVTGDEIKHDFRITNIGKSALIIHKVKTSCGCTTSQMEKDTLAPGESTYVKALFRTQGKTGRQPKDIFIITNDPEQPKVILKIIGNIKEKQNK